MVGGKWLVLEASGGCGAKWSPVEVDGALKHNNLCCYCPQYGSVKNVAIVKQCVSEVSGDHRR